MTLSVRGSTAAEPLATVTLAGQLRGIWISRVSANKSASDLAERSTEEQGCDRIYGRDQNRLVLAREPAARQRQRIRLIGTQMSGNLWKANHARQR